MVSRSLRVRAAALLLLVVGVVVCARADDSAAADVTIIGGGIMGQAVARCLADGGRRVVVWNRTPSRLDALRGVERVRVEGDVRAAVAASPTVLVTLTGDRGMATANAILERAGDALRGKMVVQWTTHSPFAAQRQNTELLDRLGVGARVFGAMMAEPKVVCAPQGMYFLSGAADDVARAQAALAPLPNLLNVGVDVGLGSLLDVVVLFSFIFGLDGHSFGQAVVRRYAERTSMTRDVEHTLLRQHTDIASALVSAATPAMFKVQLGAALSNNDAEFDANARALVEHTSPARTIAPSIAMWVDFVEELGLPTTLLAMLHENLELMPGDMSFLVAARRWLLRNDGTNANGKAEL